MANILKESLVGIDEIRDPIQPTDLTTRVPICQSLVDSQIIWHLRIESETEYHLQKLIWHVLFQLLKLEPKHGVAESILPGPLLLLERERDVLVSRSSCSSVLSELRMRTSKVLSSASSSVAKISLLASLNSRSPCSFARIQSSDCAIPCGSCGDVSSVVSYWVPPDCRCWRSTSFLCLSLASRFLAAFCRSLITMT
jgi:hypothetical protein